MLPPAASIPFEAGRLGIRTIANELNPVAALILRATCQWPQQYGAARPGPPALPDEYAAVSQRFLARVRQLIADNGVYPPEPDYDPNPALKLDAHSASTGKPQNKNFANPTVS